MNSVINFLNEKNIEYMLHEHPAVYTIDEMNQLGLPHTQWIAKNLFLRDDKKRNYYLLVVRENKKINLKELRVMIDSRPLTFASEKDLDQKLGLIKGAVTPFGIINNHEHDVKILIDTEFEHHLIGVHPNVNTATVFLQANDLMTCLKDTGNSCEYLEI